MGCLQIQFLIPISLAFENLKKEISIIKVVSLIKWTDEEVVLMDQIEQLQFAVIGKFTVDWSNFDELRKIIPQQCDIKGSCKIDLLRSKHILIRLSQQEDFVNLISKGHCISHVK